MSAPQPRWSPKNGQYGGANPKPTAPMKKFLAFLQDTGGWLREDPVKVHPSVVLAAKRLGWATVELDEQGRPDSACITALGRAAFTWGRADVHSPD